MKPMIMTALAITPLLAIDKESAKRLDESATVLACGILSAQAAQAPNPTLQSVSTADASFTPTYRVTVVARTIKAINYNHRSGATEIGFRGTSLMPQASGDAKVEIHRTRQL